MVPPVLPKIFMMNSKEDSAIDKGFLKVSFKNAIITKNKIKIFVLSSTLDSDEIKKAKENKYVSDFWNKPFRLDLLKSTFL